MIADLEELRERIAAWPDEEQAAALFALAAIEGELEDRADDRTVDEMEPSSSAI